MSVDSVGAAFQRVEAVLKRRPETGVHDDAPATARWQGGTRMVASHATGTEIATDMPTEFGGTGDKVSPGWLFRAGTAACTATTIQLRAAARGIALSVLEVRVTSQSDARGMFEMADADGRIVPARPLAVQLEVRIAAAGRGPAELTTLVEDSCRCSPITDAVSHPVPTAVRVVVVEG